MNYHVYKDYDNRLSLSIDDKAIIEKILNSAESEYKSAAWRCDPAACRDYCNLWLDVKSVYNEIMEEKEKEFAKTQNQTEEQDDSLRWEEHSHHRDDSGAIG